MSGKFNPENCVKVLKEIINPTPQIPAFCEFLQEILYLMSEISSVISMAFADIETKNKILIKHVEDYKNPNLYDIIDIEKQNNVIECNGENNKKVNKDYPNYVSAGRTCNVLLRFLKFLRSLFTMFQTDCSFKDCVKTSYKNELAPHHAWLVRKGAETAFSASPSKDKVIPVMGPNHQAVARELQNGLDALITELQQFYEKNDLLGLP